MLLLQAPRPDKDEEERLSSGLSLDMPGTRPIALLPNLAKTCLNHAVLRQDARPPAITVWVVITSQRRGSSTRLKPNSRMLCPSQRVALLKQCSITCMLRRPSWYLIATWLRGLVATAMLSFLSRIRCPQWVAAQGNTLTLFLLVLLAAKLEADGPVQPSSVGKA